MTEARSSFAIALDYYKGPRPGIALTVAARCPDRCVDHRCDPRGRTRQ